MSSYIFICIILTLFGALGGFFFKKASSSSASLVGIAVSPFLYLGGSFYVFGALLNIYVLKKLDYTIVLPLTSLTYIWTMLLSLKFMKEKFTVFKFLGVLFIISGAIIISSY